MSEQDSFTAPPRPFPFHRDTTQRRRVGHLLRRETAATERSSLRRDSVEGRLSPPPLYRSSGSGEPEAFPQARPGKKKQAITGRCMVAHPWPWESGLRGASVQARDEGSKQQAAAAARSSEEVVGGVEVVVWEGKETKG